MNEDRAVAKERRGFALLSRFIVEAPDPQVRLVQVIRVGALLYGLAGIVTLVGALLPLPPDVSERGLVALGIWCVVVSMIGWTLAERIPAWLLLGLALAGVGSTTLGGYFLGHDIGPHAAMLYVWIGAFSFCVFRRSVAIMVTTAIAIAYPLGLAAIGEPLGASVNRWVFTISTVVVASSLTGWAFHYAQGLAAKENAARKEAERAREELATLNRELEERVDAQVGELERYGRLKRFLSPAVADAVVGAEAESFLEPHRREISVLFIDLRGFTAFARGAEPEEVARVLSAFYEELGELAHRFQATVGTFSGDGVMVYFNDPLPCEDPAGTAVEMALECRKVLGPLVETWSRRGYDLSYGIGIAKGFATIGMIGFGDRHDYTPVGTVVNLASRLCDAAGRGQILIDPRTLAEVPWVVGEELPPVKVKCFADPIPPFSVKDRATDADRVPPTPARPEHEIDA